MPQGFDKTKPEYRVGLDSGTLRTQFNSLCSHHEGTVEPLDIQEGMVWLDRSDSSNWKLKIRSNGAWRILFEHLNDYATPVVPGGASQFVFDQASPVNPWVVSHGIGKRVVEVIVVDASFNRIDASAYTVLYNSDTQLTITFVTGPTSGKAYLQ